MDKDAYYFPHFSNARNDRKIRRLRKELGVEGYGIYFMILEVLRDQNDFKYPMEDIDLLADEFKTSDQKVRVVVCNYGLFQVDEEEQFFSPKFMEYLSPYLESKHRNRVSGIKGNLIKYGYATKKELNAMSDDEILRLNEKRGDLSGGDSGGDRNKSKVKKTKLKKSKTHYAPGQVPLPDSVDKVVEIANMKGISKKEAEMYYQLRGRDNFQRVDKNGNYLPIQNWHSDMVFLWRKGALNENKKGTEFTPDYLKYD